MRINLNLNKYYEGLDLEHINEIFSRMLNMKTNIDDLDYLYNESENRFEQTRDWRLSKNICQAALHNQVRDLDKYMEDIKRESIFGTEENKEIREKDYQAIIEKYRFLMSEPEKDKEDGDKKKIVNEDFDAR